MNPATNVQYIPTPFYLADQRIDVESLRTCHPSDAAEALETSSLSPLEIVETLLQIGNRRSVETFAQLSIETQQACFEAGNTQTMLRFIEHMEPDDRVDLLKKVDEDVWEAMMPLIAQAERNEIRRLLDYKEGTAGAVMTTEYASLPADITVGAAMERLRLQAPNKETIYYIYITDAQRHLLGMVSLRDLIMSKPKVLLSHVLQKDPISAPHDMGVEEVAAIISKYDFLAVPVVDAENHLLGIITVDDVIDIIRDENTEDFHLISGVVPFEEQYFKRPLTRLFWNRFLWLAVLLVASLLSTTIMELHSGILSRMVALAFFIPMVVGTCGNAGTQSATMVIRALALGEVHPRDFWRVFQRELLMGVALGCALGFMAYFRVFLQDQNMMLGWIVGVALLGTLLAANLAGALLPLVLKSLKLDPALTAGPFIATIIDAVGITIYFNVAIFLLKTF